MILKTEHKDPFTLDHLAIEKVKWGKAKGTYQGNIILTHEQGEFRITLSHEDTQVLIRQVLNLCINFTTKVAKEVTTDLQMLQHEEIDVRRIEENISNDD